MNQLKLQTPSSWSIYNQLASRQTLPHLSYLTNSLDTTYRHNRSNKVSITLLKLLVRNPQKHFDKHDISIGKKIKN